MKTLRSLAPPALVLSSLVLFAGEASAQRRSTFESDVHGFKITYPSGWSVVPIQTGEEWILAKFLSGRKYIHNDEQGVSHEHRPLMRVIGFPRKIEMRREEKGEDGKTKVVVFSNPYKNYEDYLDRHHQGGGWFIYKESEEKVGGLEVLYREIKVEKLTRVPRRIYALRYRDEEMDYIVEVDVLESRIGELKRGLLKSMRSFEFTLKSAEAEANKAPPSPGIVIGESDVETRKLVAMRRKAWRERVLRDARSSLPAGWVVKDTKDFLFLSHAESRYTSYIVKQALQMRKWLDERYGDLGTGEVLKTVIRICKDDDEANVYCSGSGQSFFSWDSCEVVCAQGPWILSDFHRIAYALTMQYLSEKNPALWSAMPGWLSSGIGSYVGDAQITKKKGLYFRPDVDGLVRCRKLVKERKLFPVKDIFGKTASQIEEENSGLESGDVHAVTRYFVRYLLEAPKKKSAFLEDYLSTLLNDLDDFEAVEWNKLKEKYQNDEEPLTEEEEDARFRNYHKRGEEWSKAHEADRRRFLEHAFKEAFGDWSERDWDGIQRGFTQYIVRGP